MILAKQNIGLNGFWGSLWNGFKRAIGLRYDSEQMDNNAGSGIGRRLGNFLTRVLSTITAGIVDLSKTEYIPTQAELIILNPLTVALNDYMIAMVDSLENTFRSNTSTEVRLQSLNNAIRKVQNIQMYFALNLYPGLSSSAQQDMADQIGYMVQSLELTIEDLLTANGIDYVKTEGALAVNSSDSYPAGLNLQSFTDGYGYQYRVENAEEQTLTTNVPSSPVTAVSIIPNQETVITTDVAGTDSVISNSNGIIAFVLFAGAALIAVLMDSNKKEKNKN